MPDFTHVNWLAVIIAAVASIAIGFAWYMPPVFGRRWAAETGIELPGGGDASPMTWVYGIVQALLIAYVLALFAAEADIAGGIVIGALLWLGFVATTKFNSVVENTTFGSGFQSAAHSSSESSSDGSWSAVSQYSIVSYSRRPIRWTPTSRISSVTNRQTSSSGGVQSKLPSGPTM